MLTRTTIGSSNRSIVAYTAPMVLFLLFTALEEQLPRAWYPVAYTLKVVVVSGCLIAFREVFRDLRPRASVVLPSIAIGMAVCVAWVAIEKAVPYPHFSARIGFNPFEALALPVTQLAFVAIRLYGLALMVPVMEELFWRAFLLRYLTSNDFLALPVEAFSWTAFAAVAVLFALGHPEWLPALLTACIYGLLLRQTRSVFAAVVAHATTNAALGIYILVARDWMYW